MALTPLAPVVVQPRQPFFEQTVTLAVDNGYHLELIHLSHPDVLDSFDADECARLRSVLAPLAGNLWLHGPFYDLYVNSPDAQIRSVSEKRVEQSLRVAELLGITRVVFHTNHLPCTTKPEYTQRWREMNASFWSGACGRFSGRILLENMWDDGPELLRGLLDEVPDLLACLDTGHAHIFSSVSLPEWVRVLGDRLRYVHLSDNDGTADDALPPGEGTIDWPAFTSAVLAHAPRPAVMVGMDVAGLPATTRAITRMKEADVYPYVTAADARRARSRPLRT